MAKNEDKKEIEVSEEITIVKNEEKKQINSKVFNIIQFCDMNLSEGMKRSFFEYCKKHNSFNKSLSEKEWFAMSEEMKKSIP